MKFAEVQVLHLLESIVGELGDEGLTERESAGISSLRSWAVLGNPGFEGTRLFSGSKV